MVKLNNEKKCCMFSKSIKKINQRVITSEVLCEYLSDSLRLKKTIYCKEGAGLHKGY